MILEITHKKSLKDNISLSKMFPRFIVSLSLTLFSVRSLLITQKEGKDRNSKTSPLKRKLIDSI